MPEDVQAVFEAVAAHRLVRNEFAGDGGSAPVLRGLLESVAVPA
jgi:hypothetical protein